jgi:hemoglobin
MTKPDVESRDDLQRVMVDFYAIALRDEMIGHHFTDLDLSTHIPITVDFWEKALFAKPTYYRNTFAIHKEAHAKHPMIPEHFVRWVEIFCTVVDGKFAGEAAELLKLRARSIADSMSLGLNSPGEPHFVSVSPTVRA